MTVVCLCVAMTRVCLNQCRAGDTSLNNHMTSFHSNLHTMNTTYALVNSWPYGDNTPFFVTSRAESCVHGLHVSLQVEEFGQFMDEMDDSKACVDPKFC